MLMFDRSYIYTSDWKNKQHLIWLLKLFFTTQPCVRSSRPCFLLKLYNDVRVQDLMCHVSERWYLWALEAALLKILTMWTCLSFIALLKRLQDLLWFNIWFKIFTNHILIYFLIIRNLECVDRYHSQIEES